MPIYNSLTVFLAFLAFLAFGYLSLVRLMYKQSFTDAALFKFFSGINTPQLLRNLGSSAFFMSLPATSLLLFWGWGPALLWLIIFHLLVESLFHLQYSASAADKSIADYLLRSQNSLSAMIEQGLIQAFFLLSMAMITALMATLVDRQSGLLFALLFLLPARGLMRHSSTALPLLLKLLGGLALIGVGLAFSDQLGFSIYGDWAPFGDKVPWLRFNNPTMIAAVLVTAVFQLEKNTGFKNDLSTFAGVIIVALLLAMAIRLLWLDPLLDAPLNATQVSNTDLPAFISLNLFLFAGFAAFLVRLLNEEDNNTARGPSQFSRLQGGATLHLLFILVLTLSLASATGIGAWKTHFLNWNDSLNLLDHLNLAISSTLSLISADARSGTVLHTLLLASLCFTGFSFMLMCTNQLSLEERQQSNVLSLIIEAKVPQGLLIFISSAYFIANGISLDTWLIIGMLSWALVAHLLLGITLATSAASIRRNVYGALCLLLVFGGVAQTLLIGIRWVSNGENVYAGLALLILLLAVSLWRRDLPTLLRQLKQTRNKELF